MKRHYGTIYRSGKRITPFQWDFVGDVKITTGLPVLQTGFEKNSTHLFSTHFNVERAHCVPFKLLVPGNRPSPFIVIFLLS